MSAEQCIIIEKARNHVTVLTSDGRFLKIPIRKCEYMVGEQVSLRYLSEATPDFEPSWKQVLSEFFKRRLIPAAVVASLILLMSFFGYTQYLEARPALAWVTLDLLDYPGSIELEVNDKGLIKSVTCFDQQGQEVMSGHNLYMKSIDHAIEALLNTTEESSQSGIVIGIIPIEENSAVDALEAKIMKDAQKAAEKAAKEAAKRAAKAAEKEAKENWKEGKKGPQSEPGGPSAASTGAKSQVAAATVNKVRLDKEIRETAKELKISAARAALWALFEEPAQSEPVQGTEAGEEIPGPGSSGQQAGNQGQPGNSQGFEPKEPPGQSKKQGGFTDSIPRPGINKMNKKNPKQEKDHLAKITKKWVQNNKNKAGSSGNGANNKKPGNQGSQGNSSPGGK